jgi:hypothetical protein
MRLTGMNIWPANSTRKSSLTIPCSQNWIPFSQTSETLIGLSQTQVAEANAINYENEMWIAIDYPADRDQHALSKVMNECTCVSL